MPKVSLVIILLLQAVMSFAQNYFVFIGSDNRQPFYVRVDSQFHSSSAEGHLILSQLKDSTYHITIGFPGQTQPEQHYSFSIDGKDQAFELRPQDPGDLRLYDLQNNQWLSLQGGGVAAADARSAGVKKDDAFSRMMAGVVQDTAVLYNTYAMEQALSDSPAVAATAKADTPAHSAPPDTAASTLAVTTPPATTASPDSAAGKSTDTTIAATNNPANPTAPVTAVVNPATPPSTAPPASSRQAASVDSASAGTTSTDTIATGTTAARPADTPTARPADTAATRPAGTITHQPAARFSDSGATAPLYRPATRDAAIKSIASKDAATAAAPIPSTVGAPLYRTAPGVTKLSEHHTTKNVRLVYADRSAGKKADTIVVIIPVDSPAMAKTGHQPHGADSNHIPAGRAHGPNPNADSPVLNSGSAYRPVVPPTASTDATRPHPADSSHKPGKSMAFFNSDCHNFATDFDVDRLRVRMLQSGKDEDRITVARKAFKVKCFYTRQIRALSEVFTSDAGKFRFFEAAWPFAADEHFHELSDLLSDPVYNNKFKAMTHQQ
ncbi:MAG TPA: hypothetical protein VGS79_01910 [Puia sp.]|nr:hypothetical protein [Puia sp.]